MSTDRWDSLVAAYDTIDCTHRWSTSVAEAAEPGEGAVVEAYICFFLPLPVVVVPTVTACLRL